MKSSHHNLVTIILICVIIVLGIVSLTNQKKESFLSIISPDQCTFHHLGSFRLNTDKMWEKLDSISTITDIK